MRIEDPSKPSLSLRLLGTYTKEACVLLLNALAHHPDALHVLNCSGMFDWMRADKEELPTQLLDNLETFLSNTTTIAEISVDFRGTCYCFPSSSSVFCSYP